MLVEQYSPVHPATPESHKGTANAQLTPVQKLMDEMLINDYSILKFNGGFAKFKQQLESKHRNPLILQYVKSIYEEYKIPDPLGGCSSRIEQDGSIRVITDRKRRNFINLYSSKGAESNLKTSTRQATHKQSQAINLNQRRNGNRTRTEPRQERLRREDSEGDEVLEESTIPKYNSQNRFTQVHSTGRYFNSDQDFSDVGVVNQFKEDSQVEEEDPYTGSFSVEQALQYLKGIPSQEKKLNNESFLLQYLPQISELRSQQSSSLSQVDQLVNQSYRYCIGCEKALLDVNIDVHEKLCSKFKRIFQMNPAQIVEQLKQKIHHLQNRIRQQFKRLALTDLSDLNQQSLNVLKQSRIICEEGVRTDIYSEGYEGATEICRRWCLVTQEINKINWFLKIRQRIKLQFGL